MMELLARVEALLRRPHPISQEALDTFSFGNVRVDFRRAEITREETASELSPKELQLLRFLIERRGELLTRDALLNGVWGYGADVYSRTVDQHIALLRRKLEPTPSHPRHMVTVHGLGYKFVG